MAKKKGLWILIAVSALALFFVLYTVSAYNRFVTYEQNIEAKWSEVESQYQRQADLIPNLVSVVSSAVSVETKFVQDVIAARTRWNAAQTEVQRDAAGQQMNAGVTAFVNAVSENYPTLQANTQYVALTDELSGTQNRITTARGRYIEAVQQYNTATKRFPGVMLARLFGFGPHDYYTAEEGSMETPVLGSGNLPQ